MTSLDSNVRCGNSLIDDPEIAGDKAFDWNKEFYDIMQGGGFDVIVMNPPYVKEAEGKEIFTGLHKNPDYQGKMDLWYLFGGLALGLVKKEVGVIGLIDDGVDVAGRADKAYFQISAAGGHGLGKT